MSVKCHEPTALTPAPAWAARGATAVPVPVSAAGVGAESSTHEVIHRARAIPTDVTTLPEHFRSAGWSTYGVAYKAYLYNMGFEQGFDT